jgi:hypothetical protein
VDLDSALAAEIVGANAGTVNCPVVDEEPEP